MRAEITFGKNVSATDEAAVRARFESLDRYVDEPLIAPRLTLRHSQAPHARHPYVADASTRFKGRMLAAHATGTSAVGATEAVVERLRRQLRRVAGTELAKRDEGPSIGEALAALAHQRLHRPEARLKPAEERQIVHKGTYADRPAATLEAIADLLDLDEEFHLFRHVRTGEDVVVYRRDDSQIGLLFPPGSALADEGDLVVAEPSRYPEPVALERARTEMDELNHRFLYFIDAADGRGKVLYLRHDGDYGLVEPE